LIDYGYKVTILDNLSKKIHSSNNRYNKLKVITRFIIGDVCSRSDWEKAISNQDVIIHLAAETGTGQSMYDIHNYTNVNMGATALMLDVLTNSKNSVKKIILSSSRAVYGEGMYKCKKQGVVFPLSRNDKDLKDAKYDFVSQNSKSKLIPIPTKENSQILPTSIYALTKYNQEQILLLAANNLNLDVAILRYQNVFGPGQSLSNPYTGILSIFSTRILNGNDIEIYEDGMQTRDFVYIDDVVNATVLVLENSNLKSKVYNVGSGEPITVLKVAQKLKELYNTKASITISNKYRKGDIRHNFADLSLIKQELGFVNEFSFNSGLLNFVEWVKKQDIQDDMYDSSILEMIQKGIMK
jgi:dTDP-L-rhamnose 4-epimerase